MRLERGRDGPDPGRDIRAARGAKTRIGDRASKLILLQRVDRKTSVDANDAPVDMPDNLKLLSLTVTSGNGREFVDRVRVAKAVGAGFLFADACSFWQRGLNKRPTAWCGSSS